MFTVKGVAVKNPGKFDVDGDDSEAIREATRSALVPRTT
jgi:hypothetical protein